MSRSRIGIVVKTEKTSAARVRVKGSGKSFGDGGVVRGCRFVRDFKGREIVRTIFRRERRVTISRRRDRFRADRARKIYATSFMRERLFDNLELCHS